MNFGKALVGSVQAKSFVVQLAIAGLIAVDECLIQFFGRYGRAFHEVHF